MVSFGNTVVMLTSNAGAHLIIPGPEVMRDHEEEVHEGLLQELGVHFRPEFLNRVEEILDFHLEEECSYLGEHFVPEGDLRKTAAR